MATSISSQRNRTTAQASSAAVPMLPNEVVAEIIKLLPVKSILRFKSVCKGWLTMLSNPSFICDHLDCSKKKPSTLIVPTPARMQRGYNSETLSMAFYRYPATGERLVEMISEHAVLERAGNIYLLAHCDGLLAVGTTFNIYACNPATRELVRLPSTVTPCAHGMRDLQAFACRCGVSMSLCIGRDPRSGSYKVFRTFDSQRDGQYSADVEVLTLGADESNWRRLPGFPWNILPLSMASIDGTVYWLINYDINDQTPRAILCLDISTERLTLVPIPLLDWIVEQTTVNSLLAEVQGKLCFFHVTLDGVETNLIQIWFVSDMLVSPTWKRYCIFNASKSMTIWWPILMHESGEIILLLRQDDLCTYDRRSNEFKIVVDPRDLVDFSQIRNQITDHYLFVVSNFVESLVAITPKRTH